MAVGVARLDEASIPTRELMFEKNHRAVVIRHCVCAGFGHVAETRIGHAARQSGSKAGTWVWFSGRKGSLIGITKRIRRSIENHFVNSMITKIADA
jgi:hypothetical protein